MCLTFSVKQLNSVNNTTFACCYMHSISWKFLFINALYQCVYFLDRCAFVRHMCISSDGRNFTLIHKPSGTIGKLTVADCCFTFCYSHDLITCSLFCSFSVLNSVSLNSILNSVLHLSMSVPFILSSPQQPIVRKINKTSKNQNRNPCQQLRLMLGKSNTEQLKVFPA